MQSWSSQDGGLLGNEALSRRVLTLVKHRPETLEIICFLGSRIVRASEGRESVERALAPRPRSRQRKPGPAGAGAGRARVRALAPGSMTLHWEAGCGIFQEELNFWRFYFV